MENDNDYFTIGEKYKLKIQIIPTSEQKEYLNIFIKDTSSSEEYNSNFDFDYLQDKSFFKCLNLQIIFSIIQEQLKQKKVQINKCPKRGELKLSVTLNKKDEILELIIPKYNKSEIIDKE